MKEENRKRFTAKQRGGTKSWRSRRTRVAANFSTGPKQGIDERFVEHPGSYPSAQHGPKQRGQIGQGHQPRSITGGPRDCPQPGRNRGPNPAIRALATTGSASDFFQISLALDWRLCLTRGPFRINGQNESRAEQQTSHPEQNVN